MDLPTYTNIWRIEKRLYKLYDFRLPMPLPIGQIAVFAAIALPYILILTILGLPFSHTYFWLYVLPPGVLAWLATRPVLESKRLPELIVSQVRYLGEPKTWCRLAPLAEKDEVVVFARVWHQAGLRERPAMADEAVPSVSAAPARTAGTGRAGGRSARPGVAARPGAPRTAGAAPGRAGLRAAGAAAGAAAAAGAVAGAGGTAPPAWPGTPARRRGAARTRPPVTPARGPAGNVAPAAAGHRPILHPPAGTPAQPLPGAESVPAAPAPGSVAGGFVTAAGVAAGAAAAGAASAGLAGSAAGPARDGATGRDAAAAPRPGRRTGYRPRAQGQAAPGRPTWPEAAGPSAASTAFAPGRTNETSVTGGAGTAGVAFAPGGANGANGANGTGGANGAAGAGLGPGAGPDGQPSLAEPLSPLPPPLPRPARHTRPAIDLPSAAWPVAGHPAGPEADDAGPFADYPSGPMPAYPDDSLLEDLPDMAEPLAELPARPAEVASAGPLADPAGRGPADVAGFGPPEATLFGPPEPAAHGAAGAAGHRAAANGSPAGEGQDGEEGLPPVRPATPKNPSRRPVVVPPPPGPMDDQLPPVRPPAPPWPGIQEAVAQPPSPPPAAAGRPLASPVSFGPAALPATAQLTVPPGTPTRPAAPGQANRPAASQPDHGQQGDSQVGQSGHDRLVAGQPDSGQPGGGRPDPGQFGLSGPAEPVAGQQDHGQPGSGQPVQADLGHPGLSGSGEPAAGHGQADGGQLDPGQRGESGAGEPVAGQQDHGQPGSGQPGQSDFGPPEPLRLAGSARPLAPAEPPSGPEPADAPLADAQAPHAGQAAQTGLAPAAEAALAAAAAGPAMTGDVNEAATGEPEAPAAEAAAAAETPAAETPAAEAPAAEPAEPPAARPTVTVTGDRGGDRPLRVVERALRGSSDRRGDGWRDRVVVVPGGHRPGQPDFAQRDRARALLQVAGSRRIVVLGCTVGAGQTMTTLMTGEILARIRDEPVAVLDLNSGSGSLAQRAGAMPAVAIGPPPNGSGPASQASRAQPRPSQLAVIGSEALAGQNPGEDSGRSAARVLELLSARYHLTLADPGAPAVPRVLSIADQLILVAPASADAARAIAMTMEWLEAHGHAELASGSITVINGVSRPTMGYVEQAEAVARGRCRAIVRVPWDDQLRTNEDGPGDRLLGPAAVQAYTALAGVLVAGLATAPEPRRAQPRQAQL